MGSAVSVADQNQVPAILDRKTFYQITDGRYKPEAYDCFVDDDGHISKGRFIDVVSNADVYLSHDWGLDDCARSSHDRALKIGNYLSKKGLFVSADYGPDINNEVGKNSSQQTLEKMQKAQCILIFLTTRYCQQIASPHPSLAKEEFFTALSAKGPRFMLPVQMEEGAKLTPNSPDVIWELFKGKYCVNCSTFEKHFTTRYGLKKVKILENSVLDDLYDCIVKTVKPLRDGGFYTKQQFIRANTVPGRHYTWLKTWLPQFDHTKCARYSSLFTEAGVTTSTKLFHLVQCDGQFLIKLGVTPADSALIYKKLHDDIIGNMNVVAAVKIDSIIAAEDERERQRLDLILEERDRTDSLAVMYQENVKMGFEDELSCELREEWRRSTIKRDFDNARFQLYVESMEQSNALHDRIFRAQKLMFQQFCQNTDSQRIQEYVKITRITSGVVACGAVRHLLLRVEREVNQSADEVSPGSMEGRGGREERAVMMGRSVYRDRVDVVDHVSTTIKETVDASNGGSSSNGRLMIRDEVNTNIQKYVVDTMRLVKAPTSQEGSTTTSALSVVGHTHSRKLEITKTLEAMHGAECEQISLQPLRASKFIKPGVLNVDEITDESAPVDTNVGDFNGNALFNYLQEAVLLMHLIVVLAKDNPRSCDNITDMVENSIAKLWTPLMNLMYHFDYAFDCSTQLEAFGVDQSFYRLSAPQEGLFALKYLMRYSPYRHSTNLKIVYLFGAANTIELCLEIVKFHFTNRSVVLVALECVLIMMDNVEYYREYAARVMRERNYLMMLLMLLQKHSFDGDGEGDVNGGGDDLYCLMLNVVILNILSLVIRTNQFNSVLLKHHCHTVIGKAINLCIKAVDTMLSRKDHKAVDCNFLLTVEQIEVIIRLLNTLDCVFLDHSHIVSFNSTIDNKPSPDNVGLLAARFQSPQAVIGLLTRLLEYSLGRDNTLSQYIAFTVGNVVYNRLEYKLECSRCSIITSLAKVLSDNMTDYNDGSNAVEACDNVLRTLVSLSNVLVWQHNAVNVIQFNNEAFDYVRNGGSKKTHNSSTTKHEDAIQFVVQTMIEKGVCEVVMNIFRVHSDHRSLVRAALLICCKLCFKGQYEACHRLVTLGICEHILRIYNVYKQDTEMFFLFMIVFTGLSESHPNLVGAAKRLVSAGICSLVTEGLRMNCKVSGSRKWSHLNYPFTCRICLQSCQCVFSLTGEHSGAEALRKFTKCGFQGILLKPPELQCDSLDLDDLFVNKASEKEEYTESQEDCLPRPLKNSLDLAMLVLFEEGKFNGNIEYCVNVSPDDKLRTMDTLFTLFHVT